jgi:hypothetical protein
VFSAAGKVLDILLEQEMDMVFLAFEAKILLMWPHAEQLQA